MKNRFQLILAIFCLAVIIFSCRKDLNHFFDDRDTNAGNLEQVKIFYAKGASLNQNSYRNLIQEQRSGLKSIKNKAVFYKLGPIWKEAWSVRSAFGHELLIVPTKENSLVNKEFTIRRVFIFTKIKGVIQNGEIVEFLTKGNNLRGNFDHIISEFEQQKIKNFSGAIMRYDLNYFPLGGQVFENGVISYKISQFVNLPKAETTVVDQSGSSASNSNGGSTCSELYWCYGNANPGDSGCTFIGYSDGCWSSGSGSDSNYSSGSGSNTGGGGSPYGGNNPPPTQPVDIRNKCTEPCIKKTVNEALSKNVVGALDSIIKKFDSSKNVNISIYDGSTVNGSPAQTDHGKFTGNVFSADITLQTSYYVGTSKESVVSHLIHEFVHAYLLYTGNKTLDNEQQHQVIAEKYVTPMAKYLAGYFNMSIKNAYALAWSGIPDSKAFQNATDTTEFNMFNGLKITKAEILSIAPFYNETDPLYRTGEYICN